MNCCVCGCDLAGRPAMLDRATGDAYCERHSQYWPGRNAQFDKPASHQFSACTECGHRHHPFFTYICSQCGHAQLSDVITATIIMSLGFLALAGFAVTLYNESRWVAGSFAALPAVGFGVMIFFQFNVLRKQRSGADRRPADARSLLAWLKRSYALQLWQNKHPKCFRCDCDTAAVVARHQQTQPEAHAIGNLVGICERCRNAYCIDHCRKPNPHDFFDDGGCPVDGGQLDFYWDNDPTSDKPWRIGARPT